MNDDTKLIQLLTETAEAINKVEQSLRDAINQINSPTKICETCMYFDTPTYTEPCIFCRDMSRWRAY